MTPPTRRPERPPGFVLPVALGMVVCLALLALGMLAVGERERRIATRLEELAVLRSAAESAARARAGTWSTRAALTVPVGGADTQAFALPAGLFDAGGAHPPSIALVVERYDSTLFGLRVRARRPGVGAAGAGAGLLVRVLDPADLERRFPAVVLVDSATLEGGLVSGTDGCPGSPAMTGVWSAGAVVATGEAQVRGDPAVRADPLPAHGGVDPLQQPLVGALADLRVPAGHPDPRPASADGRCDPDRGWGSTVPGTPCHDRLPLVLADGPLRVDGGEGRGILVVDGDLSLGGSFRFEGLVAVTGRLTLADDASIRGAARAASLHATGGRILGDACAVHAAASAPALDRAFIPGMGAWMPAF